MQVLGKGVYGKVYGDDSGYVYKVFYTDCKINESGWIREVVSLKNLSHPNIVHPKFIGFNFAQNPEQKECPNMYIKMKKYSQLLRINDNLSDEDILQSILDLFNGLAYLHSKLIMHRDIKEANLLYEPSSANNRIIGKLVICDFSLARYTINTSDIKNFNYLTPETITITHRPPEVFQSMKLAKKNGLKKGKIEYNHLVDIWSVGIVMFYLLTGMQLYHAIFTYGKNDKEFIDFISKMKDLSYIKTKINAGDKLNAEDCENIYTYLLLSDSAIICIRRWLSKYANKKLKHIKFFVHIMFECLKDVNVRPSASDLAFEVSKYVLDNDLTAEINDSGFLDESKVAPENTIADNDKFVINYIISIIEPVLPQIHSQEVCSLIIKKMQLILDKFCAVVDKRIDEINKKYVIAAAHIVEILFLYANIFTDYFSIGHDELYKYINAILAETNYLSGLF